LLRKPQQFCTSFTKSLGWHADAAIHADGFGIHVTVGHALDDHRSQLGAVTQTVREQHTGLQLLFELLAAFTLTVNRCVDEARCNGKDGLEEEENIKKTKKNNEKSREKNSKLQVRRN